MPHPNPGEGKSAYISRCMGSGEMNSQFPDKAQRAAVCYSYWRKKHGIGSALKGLKKHGKKDS